MTLSSTASTPISPLALRARELRGGLHGFRIFVACTRARRHGDRRRWLVSRAASPMESSARAAVILGGDLSFVLIHREATPPNAVF
jgi:putative ABC transport system permease protein